MDVRTFEAYSMKDAVKSVKKALGTDAVVLSTREKPAPNGKGTVYEVTAAAAGFRKAGATVSPAAAAATLATDAALESLNARITALADSVPSKTQVQTIEAGMRELKLLLIETLRGKDGSVLQDVPSMMIPVERQLRVMGVDDIAITELLKHLRTLPPPSTDKASEDNPDLYYRDQAMRWMMKRIKIAPRWTIMQGAVSYQAVVGPTGVGKSSVVAKLAAYYSMREKHKVAVVSLDNHRLAASEQMRIFCKIINVPYIAAASAEDVAQVTTKLSANRDTELVLIDTAGFSPKNAAGIGELTALREAGIPVDFHLCLSMTEKQEQLDGAVRAFSTLGLQSFIFAKIDESWSFGEIFNLSRRWTLPLSFFSIGQQIPDDVERATRERVIERIFGL